MAGSGIDNTRVICFAPEFLEDLFVVSLLQEKSVVKGIKLSATLCLRISLWVEDDPKLESGSHRQQRLD